MRRALGAVLGAVAGLAFSTMGLVDTSQGVSWSGGGNEATPIVIAVGIAIGAMLGAAWLWRFPFAILGAIVGLEAGMWLRDNLTFGSVQPPWVFFLLFGLPVLGSAAGYSLHLPSSTWSRYPFLRSAALGFAAAVATYVSATGLWLSVTHDPACDPISRSDGSVVVPLCPASGQPLWTILLGVVAGAAVGLLAYRATSSTTTR